MRGPSAIKSATALLALIALAGAAPASGTWTQQTIPSAGATSFLNGVSCPTATACFGVGNSATPPGAGLGLAEQWNGSAWSAQIIPNGEAQGVEAVSCSSATACTAVGNPGLPPMADRWNGNQWNEQSAKSPTGAFQASFWAVSCPASNACEATGNWQKTGFNGPEMLLAERWNANAWAIQSIPDPAGTKPVLDGVSCPAVSTCIAVGSYLSSGTQVTLAEKWNGTSWTILPTVNPGSGTGNGQLVAVSCPSATACTAVGSYHANSMELTLAEVWNGAKWTVQPTPNPSGATGSGLAAVSCPTATTCTAVGQTVIPNGGGTLAEAVAGGTWVIQSTPSPEKTSFLAGLSCRSSICIAVGGSRSNLIIGTVPVAEERG